MRKIAACLLMILMLAVGTAGCGNEDKQKDDDAATQATAEPPEVQYVGGYEFELPEGYELVTGQNEQGWSYVLYQKGDTELIAESRQEKYPKRALKDDYESRKAMNAEEDAGGKTELLKEEESQGFRYDHRQGGATTECGMEFLTGDRKIVTFCMTRAAECEDKALSATELKEFELMTGSLQTEDAQTILGNECVICGVTFVPPDGFETERIAESAVVYTKTGKEKASMTIREAGPAEPLPGKKEFAALAGESYGSNVKEIYETTACGGPAACAALEKNGKQNGVLICFNAAGTRFEAHVQQKEPTKKNLKACLAMLERAQTAK